MAEYGSMLMYVGVKKEDRGMMLMAMDYCRERLADQKTETCLTCLGNLAMLATQFPDDFLRDEANM
eukprot:13194-Eustigmatos_ZCMA.PRE.1